MASRSVETRMVHVNLRVTYQRMNALQLMLFSLWLYLVMISQFLFYIIGLSSLLTHTTQRVAHINNMWHLATVHKWDRLGRGKYCIHIMSTIGESGATWTVDIVPLDVLETYIYIIRMKIAVFLVFKRTFGVRFTLRGSRRDIQLYGHQAGWHYDIVNLL